MTQRPFPSLRIEANALVPQGSFAESQAQFLSPENQTVVDLDALLSANNIGVVAHFYMDAELQGVLSRCSWPHITLRLAACCSPQLGLQPAELGGAQLVSWSRGSCPAVGEVHQRAQLW